MEKKAYIFCFSAPLVFWHRQNKWNGIITMERGIFMPTVQCKSAFSLFFLSLSFGNSEAIMVKNDETSILSWSLRLTLVTGETNCQRGLERGIKGKQNRRKCQACSSGQSLEPMVGAGGATEQNRGDGKKKERNTREGAWGKTSSSTLASREKC